MWLKAAVEETGADGKRRMSGGKRSRVCLEGVGGWRSGVHAPEIHLTLGSKKVSL